MATVAQVQNMTTIAADLSRDFPELRTFAISDVTQEHRKAAYQYAKAYKGDNEFLRDISAKMAFYALSERQIVAILRCMAYNFRAYLTRENMRVCFDSDGNTVVVNNDVPVPTPVLSPRNAPVYAIPQCGTYTVLLLNDEYRTLKVKPVEMTGSIRMICYLSGSDNYNNYTGCASVGNDGTLRVWNRYRRDSMLVAAITLLLTRSNNAVLKSATCNRCGRKLTVPTSIHQGYGPDCAEQLGIA